MKGILRKWATNWLYASGAKTGEVTKIDPVALAPDGVRPGAGGGIGAEEMNHMIARLIDDTRALRYAGIDTWSETDVTGATSYVANGAAVRMKNGFTLLGYGSSVVGTPTKHEGYALWSPLTGKTIDSGATGVSVYSALNTHQYTYALGSNASDEPGGWRISADYSASSAVTGAGTAFASDAGIVRAVWSESNEKIALVVTQAGSSTGLFYGYLDADGTAMQDATTAPTVADAWATPGPLVAAGGGDVMMVSCGGATTTHRRCDVTSDGGVNWAAAAAHPFTSDAADCLFGLGYMDHPTHGGIFVAHVNHGGVGQKVMYTANLGATWSELWDLGVSGNEGTYIDTLQGEGRSWFVGDTLLHCVNDTNDAPHDRQIFVIDLLRGTGFLVGGDQEALGEIRTSAWDGTRLFVGRGGGVDDPYMHVSGPFGVPPISRNTTGTLHSEFD